MNIYTLMVNKKRFSLFFVALLLSVPLFGVLAPRIAYADTTGTWIDVAHIKVGEHIYVDGKIGDSMDYTADVGNGCINRIKGFNKNFGEGGTNYKNARLHKCTGGDEKITLDDTNSQVMFHWVDAGRIESAYVRYDVGKFVDLPVGIFTNNPASDPKLFVYSSGSASEERSSITEKSVTTGDFRLGGGGEGGLPVKIGSPANKAKTRDSGTPVAGGAVATEEDDSCESKGLSLSWILCPVLFAMDQGIEWLDNTIETLLTVQEDYYSNPEIEATWARVRNLAYAILIPIMLFMIIGTGLGFEFISAYTVKRAMPRLVVAVIFITLSWPITSFLITLSNDVGAGILGLMSSAVEGADNITLASVFAPSNADSAVVVASAAGGAYFAAGLALASFNLPILFLYAAMAIAILVIAFTILAFRQFLVIALALLAPLAILAWIFPGNDKFWKLWWSTFSKLLMMFPIIMMLIASGRVFAAIISNSGGNGPIEIFLKLAAYLLPYAFIPATFKLAGGVFATVTGMVNDRRKGLFDRGRKSIGEQRGKLRENASSNRRFNPNGKLGSWKGGRLNNMAGWGASPIANTKIKLNTAGGQAIMGEVNQKQIEQTGKLEQMLQRAGLNDRALNSVAGVHEDKDGNRLSDANGRLGHVKTVKDLDRTIAALRATGESNDALAAQQLDSNIMRGLVASSWSDHDLQKGSLAGAAVTQSARQGFVNGRQIAEVANNVIEDNHHDEGFGAQIASMASLAGYSQGGRLDLKPGYGVQAETDDDGKFVKYVSGLEGSPENQRKLAKTLKQTNWMSAKPQAIAEMDLGIKAMVASGDAEGKAMKDVVLLGASQFSQTDPSSKVAWQKIIDELDANGYSDETGKSLRFQLDMMDQRRSGQQGTGRDGGGTVPPPQTDPDDFGV